MSDVLSDAQMFTSEPDETVLTAALRNKDDIPILMDIVDADDVSTPVSQEMHLQQSLVADEIDSPATPSFKYEPPEKTVTFAYEPPEKISEVVATKTSAEVSEHNAPLTPPKDSDVDTSCAMSAAIQRVLERRLPALIEEVMVEISKHEGP